ncbi:arginine repressor [Vibrio sp. DW001]|uniref:arginine repressor n=1 Tax=Vibrio sp. DW001 TaxID=2912315 RepID=UPI0023B07EA6|nr:arginine repressor [Vibrio sp. DW001]WED25385.1 arginine repressor [Vibrio sp. DW001]
MTKNTQHDAIARTIKQAILQEAVSSQAQLVDILEKAGLGKIHQSMVSRTLTKLGAVRIVNDNNQLVYQLPHELEMPTTKTNIEEMINDIDYNHFFIIIKTTPSAAELVARLVDSLRFQMGILGTVSGDDTILVTPSKGTEPQNLTHDLSVFFGLTS